MTESTSTITEWSVDGLLDEISHLNSNMKDRSLAFILGAGASISSGIPAGGFLAKKWLEEIHLRECFKTGEKLEVWASKKLVINDFQLHDAAAHYAKIFELRFSCDPQSGYAALEAVMEEAEPAVGYAILAKILAATRNKVVITTNFDNLVADALALQALRAPLIVGHEALTSFINPRLSRPLIAKIHRDLHLHPKNDQNGVHNLEQGWHDALMKLFQHYTPLVIGYGGNDESLMGFLSKLPPKHIPGRLFWCYREGDYPQQRIIDIVSRHQGVLVAIAGFDEFMVQLAQALFPEFTLEDIAEEISEIGIQRTKKYQALANELMERTAKQHNSTSSIITQQAQQSISEVSGKEDENKWWQWELWARSEHDLANKKAIYDRGIQKLPESAELHGTYANFLADQCGNYDVAEIMYKKALNLAPNNATQIGNYAHFLANQRKDYDAAAAMYKRALELAPNDAHQTGNYAHFLATQSKEYDAAEVMYKRALELDPNNADATGDYANLLADCRRDYDAAEAMYKRAIELDPNNAVIIGNYAHFLANQRKNYDAAKRVFKRAIEINPHSPNIISNYAHFLTHQYEDYDTAEIMYKHSLELDPNNINNLANYASLLLTRGKQGDWPKIRNLVHKAVKLSQQTPSQALAEILLYHCLLEEITSAVVSKSIGRLKKLLEMSYERGIWDFSQLLNSCLPLVAVERHNFYRALAAAILDAEQVAALNDFSWWYDAHCEDPFTLPES